MGHVERDHLRPEVIRAPEGYRQVDLTKWYGCTWEDAVERHRGTQSLVRNLHLLEEARVQDIEPAPPIYQHSPYLYIANGGGDDDGKMPYPPGALRVVCTTEGDRDV